MGSLNVFTGANVNWLTVSGGSNLISANIVTANHASLNVTTENVGSLNVFTGANVTQLTVSGLSNLFSANAITLNTASANITSMNVSGTSNMGQVVSSGQIVATGASGVGVCPPIVYRQGGSATNWNTPGTNTVTYSITSGVVQMQCGANTMVTTTQYIPFPTPYTNSPTVLVTSYSKTGNIFVTSVTSSAFAVSANVAVQFEWLSIGI